MLEARLVIALSSSGSPKRFLGRGMRWIFVPDGADGIILGVRSEVFRCFAGRGCSRMRGMTPRMGVSVDD